MLDDNSEGRLGALATVAVGHVFEVYSVVIVAYVSIWWVHRYFPNYSSVQVLTPIAFGIAYFARPAGALLFGILADRLGRRTGLVATLSVTGAALLVVALLPGFETLGFAAQAIVIGARFLQGMTIDGETAAAGAYLFETAPAGRQGFHVAWQAAGNVLAPLLGLLAVAFFLPIDPVLSSVDRLSDASRIPLLIGAIALPFAVLIRFLLPETKRFQARLNRPSAGIILAAVVADWRTLGVAVLIASLLPVMLSLITGFLPAIGRLALGTGQNPYTAELILGAIVLLTIATGWLGDLVGRRWILLGTLVLTLLTVPLAVLLLHANPTYPILMIVQFWHALLFGIYAGVLFVTLAELMPIEIRTTGVALSLSLSTLIFGGVNTFVLGVFQRPSGTIFTETGATVLAVGWLIIVSVVCLLAALKIRDWRDAAKEESASVIDPEAIAAFAPAPISPPTFADDPNWREKLLASLSDVGIEPATAGHYRLQRVVWAIVAIVLLGFAAVVGRFIIPEAFRRDPQADFFASILWWIFSILVLSRPTIAALRRSWRAGARRAEAELQRTELRRPIFYLRSFDLDQKIGRSSIVELLTGRGYANAEQNLAKRLRRYGPVIAIGRPGEKLPTLGAARFYVSHDRWKEKVADVAQASQLVIWATGTTEGLRWEISHLLESLPPEKLIVWAHPHLLRMLPPEREIEWRRFLAILGSAFPQPLPKYLGITRFFHFDRSYRPIPETSLRLVLKAKGR